MFASSGNFAFDFNSHTIIPFDAAAMLYQDANVSFANGIINSGDPMITLVGSDVGGEQIGISVRDTNNEIQAMIEYESTGNQDEAVQVQHQLKVKADGTTISFDDYNVLGSQTQLGLGGYGFYITASSG